MGDKSNVVAIGMFHAITGENMINSNEIYSRLKIKYNAQREATNKAKCINMKIGICK